MYAPMSEPTDEDPTRAANASTALPERPSDITPIEEDRPAKNARDGALWLPWVGIVVAGVSVIGTVLALAVSFSARTESQLLVLDKKLDEAWDALGGAENISSIDGFAAANVELARRLVRDEKTKRADSPRVRFVAASVHMANSELDLTEEELRPRYGYTRRSEPTDEDPVRAANASTALPERPSDITPIEEDRPAKNARDGALWLPWVGIVVAGVSAIGTVFALAVSFSARTESQQLVLDKKLDEAWDALGGAENISSIDGFATANVELARRLVRDAKTIRADSPRVRLLAAAVHMADSELDLAEEELRLGIRASPKDYDLRHNLATVLTRKQQWTDAETEYITAMELAPCSASLHLGMGYLASSQGDHEGAIAHYSKAARLDPNDHVVQKELGLTLIKVNRLDDAAVALRRAVELSPRSAELRYHLGSAYLIMEQHNIAAAQFDEAIRLAPEKYPDAYVNLGVILRLQNDLDRAEGMLKEALRLNPNSEEANNNLGVLRIEQNELDEAIGLLGTALSIEASAPTHLNLGNAYLERGDVEEAITSYRNAIRADPNYYEPRLCLGNVYAKQGKNEEAAGEFQEAIRINPEDPAAYSDLGIVLSISNETEEALKRFEQALSLNPKSAETHLNLGLASKILGNFAEAERAFRTALTISPDLTKARKALGRLLEEIGNLHDAATEFQEGIRLRPDDAELHNHLGVVLAKLGRMAEATEEFDTATILNPDLEVARGNLTRAQRELDGPDRVE